MTPATILRYPDPRLKQECSRVRTIEEETKEIVDLLKATLFASGGLGLAAPQIGIPLRICVVSSPEFVNEGVEKADVYINPSIVEKSGSLISPEGCLSFPGLWRDIRRSEKIKVQAFDLSGQGFVHEAQGRYAACLQHEIDHIDGLCFIDRLSPMRKKIALRVYSNSRKRRPG